MLNRLAPAPQLGSPIERYDGDLDIGRLSSPLTIRTNGEQHVRLRVWSSAAVMAVAAVVLPNASAGAAQPGRQGPPACPSGSVCFFSGSDYHGSSWEWTASSGYRDLPPALHDNVGSFVASTDACFIDWDPKETRQVHNGDWRRAYGADFGGRIDGVNGGSC